MVDLSLSREGVCSEKYYEQGVTLVPVLCEFSVTLGKAVLVKAQKDAGAESDLGLEYLLATQLWRKVARNRGNEWVFSQM
jgi:hypothetical protein